MVTLSHLPYFTGQLLIALPGIGDPRFHHAVIALVSHDADGAMGIAISHPSSSLFGDVRDQMKLDHSAADDRHLLVGGPVEPTRGFVVHSRDWGGDDTIDIAGRFAISGSLDVLRAIAQGRGPRQWQLAMGHAGWSAGQLEAEIAGDAWHVTPSDEHLLFAIAPEARWHAALARDGIDPNRIALRGGRA